MQEYLSVLARKEVVTRKEFLPVWKRFKADVNNGKIRVAVKEERDWKVCEWVKEFILLGFKFGEIFQFGNGTIDNDTMGSKKFSIYSKIRKIFTASVRDGVYIGRKVTLMPSCFVNIGAYIDEGTMVDSSATVGSCAQIGKRVHIGAGVIIGGVLEPVGAYPVIIEDNCFIGAGSQITEGTIIEEGAIIGAGVTITGSTSVYDNVRGTIITPDKDGKIVIPKEAIVIPGSVKIKSNIPGAELSKKVPIIIRYGTGEIKLEESLRK